MGCFRQVSLIDLMELIHALYKSKRIKINGKPALKKDLVSLASKIFSLDLSRMDTRLLEGLKAPKRESDNYLYTKELFNYIQDYQNEIISRSSR